MPCCNIDFLCSSERIPIMIELGPNQREQIWRNFATLAKLYKSLSYGGGFIYCLANF